HNDRGGKPLNWMSPPCRLVEVDVEDADSTGDDATPDVPEGTKSIWTVTNKAGEHLVVYVYEVHHDSQHDLGQDPGLVKDGVEAHLQKLLAEHVETFGSGWTLVRREYPTAIGPVDLLCRDDEGKPVAVEIKRRGEIDGVEQLSRYLELLNRDPILAPVSGVFAACETSDRMPSRSPAAAIASAWAWVKVPSATRDRIKARASSGVRFGAVPGCGSGSGSGSGTGSLSGFDFFSFEDPLSGLAVF
ncbi:MAG: DUF91 domain-containing protein, partial [Actinobacteria bacterium]|nr:DUF91 domain-containing protein [Actinomycetota bacterium]